MYKSRLLFALMLSIALSDSLSTAHAEYANLTEAVRDTATPREYSFNGTEQVTSNIGNMATGVLTIEGGGEESGILGKQNSNSYSGIVVNTNSSLIMKNIGNAVVDYDTGAVTYTNGQGVEGFKKSGGAVVYNNGILDVEDVVFYDNNGNGTYGSVIYNNGHITNIIGKVINSKNGTAIYNKGANAIIDYIEGDFVGNVATSHGGVISTDASSIIKNINNSNFIANKSPSSGGAIRSNGTSSLTAGSDITINNSLFRYNSSRQGGAIQNGNTSITKINNSSFDKNFSDNLDHTSKNGGGGAIYNDGNLIITDSNFTHNATTYDGGAIYSSVYEKNPSSSVTIYAKDSDVLFLDNKSKVTAVSYSVDDGYTVTGGKYNDFYGTNKTSLSLNANQGKNITFNGSISLAGPTFDINADNDNSIKGGSYNFNNTVSAANLSMYNGADINLGSHDQADGSTSYGVLALSKFSNDENGGSINVQNAHIDAQNFGNLTLNSDIDLRIDTDLANGVSDSFVATSYAGEGKLKIVDINLLSDSVLSVTAKVCNSVLKDAVTLAINNVDGSSRSYVVMYDNTRSDGGYLTFSTSTDLNLVVVNRAFSPQRTYVVSEDENIAIDIAAIGDSSSSIGTMGGDDGAIFSIFSDNEHSIIGAGKGGITVVSGKTLNVENVGSLNSDNTVKAAWQGFNGALFTNNGGTVTLTGTNVIANNSGEDNLIKNIKGSIPDLEADLINNTYSDSLVRNVGGVIGDTLGLVNSNMISSSESLKGGFIYNEGTDSAGQINNINNDITNNTVTSNGAELNGIIYNYANSSNAKIGNITGDISQNTINSTSGNIYGGLIYNSNKSAKSEIGNITSDIVSNNINSAKSVCGGLIFNHANGADSTMDNISGDIANNTITIKQAPESNSALGGLIANFSNGNYNAKINEISSNITGNTITDANGNTSISGALIYNKGKNSEINSISGKITGNTMILGGHIQGGVICNDTESVAGGIINSISGAIKNNYIESTRYKVNGAIVYNYSNGVIRSLSSEIENNYIKVPNNSSILSNANGAIMNNWGTVTLTGSLKNNATNMVNIISNRGTLNILADEQDVLFDNNKVNATISRDAETGEVTVTGGENQSVRNAKTLNLYAKSGKTITLNGAIIDNSGRTYIGGTYDDNGTTATYDGTVVLNDNVTQTETTLNSGTLKLGVTNPTGNASDVLKNSNFKANSGIVNVADGSYTNYNIKKLTSSSDVRYSIDISLSAEEQKADTFTVGSGSTGTVYLSSFNVNNDLDDDTSYVLQIIKASGSSGPQLNYDNAKVITLAQAVMDSANILAKEFGLYTKKTTNDSIMVRGLQDTFKAWTKFETDEHKQYTFLDDANYTISDDVNFNGKNNADIINNGVVTNNGKLEKFNLTNNADFTNNSVISGVINNTGTLLNQNDGTISGTISNTGILTSDAGKLLTNSDIINDGTLNLTAGANINKIVNGDNGTGIVNFNGATSNSADIEANLVSSSGTFENSGDITSTSYNNTGTLTNRGNIYSKLDNSNATLNNYGYVTDVTLNVGDVNNYHDSGVIDSLDLVKGNVKNSGTISNAKVEDGNLTNNSDGYIDTLEQILGSVTNNGEIDQYTQADGTLSNTDHITTLTKNGGNTQNSGTIDELTMTAGSLANISDAVIKELVMDGGTASNSGTIENATNNSAVLTNNSDGLIKDFINKNTVRNYGTINGELDNSGTITLANEDGTLAQTGSITTSNGNNSGIIKQASLTSNGTFSNTGTINVNNLSHSGSDFTNNGSINAVEFDNSGTVANLAGHTIKISSNAENSGSLTTNASDFIADSGLKNDGNLYFTGGETQNDISGSGTVHIAGNVIISNTITDNVISLDAVSTDEYGVANMGITDISSAGKLLTNGGDFNLQYLTGTEEYKLGNVDLQSAVGMAIDVDLRGDSSLKTADNITATSVAGFEKFYINNLNITLPQVGDADPHYVKVADNILKDNVDLGDSTRTHVDVIPQKGFMISYGKDLMGANTGGFLELAYTDLVTASRAIANNRLYVMGVADEDIVAQLAEHGGSGINDSGHPFGGSSLSVNGSGTQSIFGNGSTGGFIIGENQALSLNNVKEVKDFTTAITNNGTLNLTGVKFSNNTTDIINNNVLNLYGTDEITNIIGDNGKINIKSYDNEGSTVNANVTLASGGNITQKEITIDENNVLSVNSNVFTIIDGITNDGILNLNIASNNSIISNTQADKGAVNLGTLLTANNANITADAISINSSSALTNKLNAKLTANSIDVNSTLNTNASDLVILDESSAITNYGNINFTGGKNENNIISGDDYSALSFKDVTGNTKSVKANDIVILASSTTPATIFNNEGEIQADSFTINADLTNSVDGNITAGSLTNNATITTNASKISVIGDNDSIANSSGTLILTGGENSNFSVTGGTTIIKTDDTVSVVKSIASDTFRIDKGIAHLSSDDLINATNKDNAIYLAAKGATFDESTLSVINGAASDMKFVNVILDKDLNLDIDVNFTNSKADNFGLVAGDSGYETPEIASGSNLLLEKIAVNTTDTAKKYTKILVADEHLAQYTNLDSNYSVVDSNGDVTTDITAKYEIQDSKGYLIFNNELIKNLVTYIREKDTDTYTLTAAENISDDINILGITDNTTSVGNLKADGGTFTINGEGFAIQGAQKGGMTINNGQTLNINNVSEISGFSTAAIINKNGTLNISDVVLKNNTGSDIDNSSSLNLSGTNSIDKISDSDGKGSLTVQSGTSTINTSIIQKNLSVINGAELISNGEMRIVSKANNAGAISGNGTLTVNAMDEFINSGTIEQNVVNITGNSAISNTGTLTINEFGSLESGSSIISGGTLVNNGVFNNNGNISQVLITNTNSFTSNASKLEISNKIENSGNLYLTGGNLNASVSGAGTTNIVGDVIIDYIHSQSSSGTQYNKVSQAIDVAKNASLNANVASIGGEININADGSSIGVATLYSQEANGGDLDYKVSGDGKVVFNRNVNVNAEVSAKTIEISTYSADGNSYNANVVVADGNTFGNAAGSIKVDENNTLAMANANDLAVNVLNNGNLNLYGGVLNKEVTGNGTTHVQGNVTIANTINDNILSLDSAPNSASSVANMGITSVGKIVTNEGDLNLQNLTGTESYSLGDVTFSKASGLYIDVDLRGSSSVKSADNITATSVSGTDKFYINKLKIVSPESGDAAPEYAKVADNILKDNVDLGSNTRTHVDKIFADGYMITYAKDLDGEGGFIKLSFSDLVSASRDLSTTRVYMMGTNDENIVEQIDGVPAGTGYGGSGITDDAYPLGGSALSINGTGTQSIVGGTLASGDVTNGYIVGEQQTLSLNNVKEFKGFNTAIVNNGTVNITNTNFTNNTSDIVNNKALNLYGTDTINNISGQTGTTTISSYIDDGVKNANVTIKTSLVQDSVEITGLADEDNKLTVEGTLNSKLTNAGTVDNKGSMTVNGGSNTNKLVSSNNNGEVEFKGDFSNSGEINQSKVTVTSGTLTNSGTSGSIVAEIINNSTIENNASITANGGSNSSEIKGTGSFTVSDNFTNNNSFAQNDLIVNGGKEFSNAGTAAINNSVSNSGKIANTAAGAQLLFKGQDMSIAGEITNVQEGIISIEGSGTANLTASLTNNGNFYTKSNTNVNHAISGGGVMENQAANLNVNAEISQNLFTNKSGTVLVDDNNGSITATNKISNAGTLTSNANNIFAENGIVNTNTLNLTGGETQSNISGAQGTTYIKGDVIISKVIAENVISVETGGVANLLKSSDISNATKFVANGGDLNLQGESTTDSFNLGHVDIQKNMGLAIDVDLSPEGEMNKKADSISAMSVQGNSLILINNLNIKADSTDVIPSYAKVADGVLKNSVNIGDSTRVKVDQMSPVQGVNDSFIVTYVTDVNGEGGFLKFEYCDLYNAVKSATEKKSYVLTSDENVTTDLGTLNGNTLTISGNNNKITGQGTTEGITVGENQTLSVFDVNQYSGFDTAITNEQRGTVNIENVTMTGNKTADIANNGALNFKGSDVVDTVIGNGDTVITTYTDDEGNKVKGDVTVNKSLNQNSLTLETEDDKLTNKGNINVNNLNNKGSVDNKGTIAVKGGTNDGSITGNDGQFSIDGNFTNNSEISQKTVTVTNNTSENKPFTNNGEVNADTFTNNGYTDNGDDGVISADTIKNEGTLITDASNLISKNNKPVTNNGDIEFTAGKNQNNIEGSGTTEVSGNVENTGNINNNVTVDPNASLNNNGGTLGGEGKVVTNNGNLENNGNISGTTLNNGDLTNDGKIEGNVTNNSNIDNNSSIDGNVTNGENGQITNDSGASITGNLDNKGTINNTGNINGKVDNETTGTINTTIAGLDGNITNHGNIHYTDSGSTIADILGDGTVHLDGDGTTVLNNNLNGNTLSLNNGTLVFGTNKDISNGGFVGNGGSIGNVVDGKISTYKLGDALLNTDTPVDGIDFDLSKLTSDNFIANFSGDGKLNIDKVQIKGTTLKDSLRVYLGDTTKVDKQHLNVKNQKLPTIMTPIRKLSGKIENNYLTYSGAGNGASDFNPAILASPVASLIGGQINQAQVLQDSFFHMNRYMKYSSKARLAAENTNKYAISEAIPAYARSSLPETSQAMWVKPYTTFESVDLKGSVGVSNVSYGTLYGGDTDLYDLGHGYKGIISAFIGYNGSHQSFNGIDMNQQGGTLGVTGTLYRGNFFTGLTVSAGASAGEAYTPYGRDNFSMITAGVANKTGYNIELAQGKLIIQPSIFLGYTFVNNFDYKNAAGINISSDPLNAIQIAPGVKVIGNLENNWQPYMSVDMVWNIMGKTHYTAADSRLPNLSVRPYVQYGVGVQKSWGERFTAFFQTMLRNGGRTGVVLEGGFRWTIGKKPETVKNKTKDKTVIKDKKDIKTNNLSKKQPAKDNIVSKMNGSKDVVKENVGEKKVIKQYYNVSKNNKVKIIVTSEI